MTEDLEFTVPTLEETEAELLELIDRRIRACQELKQYVQGARGTPVTKQRMQEWRQRAKIDAATEACVRTCRRLHERVLRGTMRSK
jgi:hypothetical protein